MDCLLLSLSESFGLLRVAFQRIHPCCLGLVKVSVRCVTYGALRVKDEGSLLTVDHLTGTAPRGGIFELGKSRGEAFVPVAHLRLLKCVRLAGTVRSLIDHFLVNVLVDNSLLPSLDQTEINRVSLEVPVEALRHV